MEAKQSTQAKQSTVRRGSKPSSTADATITIDRKNRDDNNNSNSCRVGVPIECNQRGEKEVDFS